MWLTRRGALLCSFPWWFLLLLWLLCPFRDSGLNRKLCPLPCMLAGTLPTCPCPTPPPFTWVPQVGFFSVLLLRVPSWPTTPGASCWAQALTTSFLCSQLPRLFMHGHLSTSHPWWNLEPELTILKPLYFLLHWATHPGQVSLPREPENSGSSHRRVSKPHPIMHHSLPGCWFTEMPLSNVYWLAKERKRDGSPERLGPAKTGSCAIAGQY